MTEEIEDAIEGFQTDPDNFDPKAFKMLNLLKGKEVKAPHARIIKGFYAKYLAELEELASGSADEQLREGYSHRSRKQIKNLIAFYQEIMSACDMLAQEAKVNRAPRKTKAVPKEKLVAKLKFKATDDKLGITSVPPTQLVGAQGAVVYNTKTRKIGIYTSLNSSGLTVKGTSIGNFTDKSTQKTLRKPEIQLREFKEQNTNKRVETWFKNIKATEVNLNGRLNAEIMILKVFK
jgi:DNA-directed RNA polymerase beta' subunit